MAARVISGPGTLARLRDALPRTLPVTAAVAYATSDEHLPLRAGDSVIVNASDANVRLGATSPDLIGRWLAAGVAVASHEELHAKVVRCGVWTAVGSANLSQRANAVEEAVWMGNDPTSARQADMFLKRLAGNCVLLDANWVRVHRPLFGTARPNSSVRVTARRRESILPHRLRRIVFYLWEADNRAPPTYVEREAAGVHRKELRGLRARFATESSNVGVSSDLAVDDLLIWVDGVSDTLHAPRLVTARPTRAGQPSAWVVLIADRTLEDEVTASLPRNLRATLNRTYEAVVSSPLAMERILAHWNLTGRGA